MYDSFLYQLLYEFARKDVDPQGPLVVNDQNHSPVSQEVDLEQSAEADRRSGKHRS